MTHAKAIFFGEHAVVYNKKGITIPLSEMTIKATLKETNTIQNRDEIINFIAQQCNISPTTEIIIDSKIPVGRGLGSSAALSIAIARANKCENVREIANTCEKFIHGNPSGIDVNQVLSETPLIFSKNDGAKPLDFDLNSHLLIIDSGIIGITKYAVERVKKNIEENKKYIDKLGEITEEVIPYLENGNVKLVGQYMNKAHEILDKLGVCHEKNNEVVTICQNNGALGAKLTGGGDGGCCIAICADIDTTTTLQKILKEKGYLSWIVSV